MFFSCYSFVEILFPFIAIHIQYFCTVMCVQGQHNKPIRGDRQPPTAQSLELGVPINQANFTASPSKISCAQVNFYC